VRSICNWQYFLIKRGFTRQRYTNTQNNRYWSSQNPHLTHEILLHPVKVGVWCAVSAKRIVVSVFFNETINCETYLRVEGQHFQHLLWSVRCKYLILNVIDRQALWFIGKIRTRLAASGAPVAVKRRAGETANKIKNPSCTMANFRSAGQPFKNYSSMTKMEWNYSTTINFHIQT
jgi:hypothetical protein